MTRPPIVCATCGTPHDRNNPCPTCPPPAPRRRTPAQETRRGTSRARGYDTAWDALSARARRLQPFCSDCGSTDNLTVDHTPQAWARRAAGKPIRLDDVDVVCAACNVARGPARGPRAVDRPSIHTHRHNLTHGE